MAFIKCLIWSCLIYEICAKNYVEIRKFELLPEADPAFANIGTLRVIRTSRTEIKISGTYYTFEKITNVGQITATGYRLNTIGVSQLQVFYTSGGFCDQMAKIPTLYKRVLENSDLPANYCPLPAGNYTIYNLVFDFNDLPVAIPPGEYLLTVVYTFNGVIKSGYKAIGVVTNE